MRLILTAAAIVLLAACLGCNKSQDGASLKTPGNGGGSKEQPLHGLGLDQYPIPPGERPYKDVHESVKKAWFLVETSYYVVREKGRTPDPEARAAANAEIDKNIFQVNKTVEDLFLEAIKAEPDNPLNIASYAMYLKPRKREKAGGYIPCDGEAMQQVEKAISLWPDDAGFYLMKVFILTEQHRAFDWFRAGAMEELAIAQQMPQIDEAFGKAEQFYPANSYVNYYHALTKFEFTDPLKFGTIREDLMREVRAGNKKPDNFFYFPPPLLPYVGSAAVPNLFGEESEAKYVDQWLLFGTWHFSAAHGMLEALAKDLVWPKDKAEIGELMFFAYQLGRCKPYDRSFFTWQQRLLDQWRNQKDLSQEDQLKLAEVGSYLSEIYREQAGRLYDKKLIADSTKLDVAGISIVESGASRMNNVSENLQAPQAAYLKKFGEVFNIKFPLPEDPSTW